MIGNEQLLQRQDFERAIRNIDDQPFDFKKNFSLKEEHKSLFLLTAISLLLTIPLAYDMVAHILDIQYTLSPHLKWFLASIVQFVVGWHFYVATFIALNKQKTNRDVLICLGTSAAYVYSVVMLFQGKSLYFESSATIITLILVGRYFEAIAFQKASSNLESLYQIQPQVAHIKKDSNWADLSLSDVQVGDLFKVFPYEKISVDGVLVEGNSYVDESVLTKESRPIYKKPGMKLYAATQNQEGVLIGKVTTTKTLFSQVIDIVEKTIQSQPPIQKFADRVSNIFVPLTLFVSLATFAVWLTQVPFSKALMNAVSVLIIACPFALSLANPIVILIATTIGAKNKILFKNLEALQKIEKLDVIAIDKTGTLTEGKPTLVDIIALSSHKKEELHKIAASLEEGSEHIIGKAILQAFHAKRYSVTDFAAFPGQGITGKISEKQYYLGSLHFLKEKGIYLTDCPIKLQTQGKTIVGLASSQQMLGYFVIGDTLNIESIEGIESLKRLNITPIMITGDDRKTAEAIANILGIDIFYANVLSQSKAEIINEWKAKGHVVGMVGNDAPALSTADIGFALGSAAHIHLEASDIVFLQNDILAIPYAIDLAKKSVRKARINIFFAFAYNILAIPLAALGILNPMIAAIAMGLSVLTVMINSLSLYKIRPLHK